jgi:hypothetical protein
MNEKTKRPHHNPADAPENSRLETPEIGDEASHGKDQREKSYYYDDACGYEIYNPDEDDEEI